MFQKQMPARIVQDLLCKLQTKAVSWLPHLWLHLELLTLEAGYVSSTQTTNDIAEVTGPQANSWTVQEMQ